MTQLNTVPKVDVLGISIGVLTPDRLMSEVESMVASGFHTYITFTGVHGVMECQRDPTLMEVFNSASIASPDGMPLVWAGRWAGLKMGSRCYGPECMLLACQLAASKRWPIFLYGGKPGVADLLAERLIEKFPGLQIVGTFSPPFRELSDEEIDTEVAMINASSARFVFVGISTPKQERWMAARVDSLDANVLFGVGAAFDFHAGLVSQAPRWMQRSGLEWLYRTFSEPRRLFWRYLRNNPVFILQILRRPPRASGHI